jgi:hypothetical protein
MQACNINSVVAATAVSTVLTWRGNDPTTQFLRSPTIIPTTHQSQQFRRQVARRRTSIWKSTLIRWTPLTTKHKIRAPMGSNQLQLFHQIQITHCQPDSRQCTSGVSQIIFCIAWSRLGGGNRKSAQLPERKFIRFINDKICIINTGTFNILQEDATNNNKNSNAQHKNGSKLANQQHIFQSHSVAKKQRAIVSTKAPPLLSQIRKLQQDDVENIANGQVIHN